MANKKISEMPVTLTLSDADVIPVITGMPDSPINKTVIFDTFRSLVISDLAEDNGADLVGYGSGITVKDTLDALNEGQAASVIGFVTRALLYSNLNYNDGTVAYVTNDTTASYNGVYLKSGASGVGTWTQSSYDRVAMAENAITVLENDFAALDAEVQELQDQNLNTRLLSVEQYLDISTQTIGIAPSNGNPVSAGYTFAISTPATVEALLVEFRCYVNTVGTIGFKVLRDNGDDTVTVIQTATVTLPGTGAQTLVDGDDFSNIVIPVGGYLGVSFYAGQGVLTFGDGATGSYYTYDDNVSGTVAIGGIATNPLLWEYDLTHSLVTLESLVNDIDTLQDDMDSAEARLDDIEVYVNASMQVVGYTPATGTETPYGYTFINSVETAVESTLTEFRCYAGTPGNIKLKAVRDNGDGTGTVITSTTVAVSAGANTLTDGVDFNDIVIPAGGFLGVTIYSSEAKLTYNVAGAGHYYVMSGDISGTFSFSTVMNDTLLWSYDLTPIQFTVFDLLDDIRVVEADIDDLESRMTVAEAYLGVEDQLIGTTPATGDSVSAGYTFTNSTPATVSSTLKEFRCYAAATGAIKLKVIRVDGNGLGTVVEDVTLTLSLSGLNVFTDGVDFNDVTVPKGGLIGISFHSTGLLTYNATGEGSYYTQTGDITGEVVIGVPAPTALLWQFTLTPDGTSSTTEEESSKYRTLLESVTSFGTLPTLWVNTSSLWTLSSGKAASGTVGLANQLRADRAYGLDHRLIRWEFQLTNVTTTIAFLTNPTETAYGGSIIRFNSSTHVLEIMTSYTGSNTPTVLHSEALGFNLATGKRYIVEWESADRAFTVRIWNKSGSDYFTYSRTAIITGEPDQGEMHGKPGVAVIAGSADVYSFKHYAVGAKDCQLYMLGDSITEGYYVTDAEKYTALVRACFDDNQVHVSGVGGAIFTGGLIRMVWELSNLKPKYVFVYLGTNAGGEVFLPYIVEYAKLNGATVIVATVPTDATTTAAINALDSDVIKVAFDLALTATGAGSAVIESLYEDAVHPNAAGHIRMFRRMQLDAPELFN